MSATTPDIPDEPVFTTIGPEARIYEQYAAVELEDNAILLYDRKNETAWIRSDATVNLTETA